MISQTTLSQSAGNVAQLGPMMRAKGPGILLQAYSSGGGSPSRIESRCWLITDLGTNSDSAAA